jgi:hypothetical protein
MKKSNIFCLILLIATACTRHDMPDSPTETQLLVAPSVVTGDADNLPEEYAILNMSLFLTDASKEQITDKFVYANYSRLNEATMLNCQLVRLPLDPAKLSRKDIYIIANCDNVDALNAVESLADLEQLYTPRLDHPHILTTARGLPMYGESLNTDLSASAENPVAIHLDRACSKLRLKLVFPNEDWTGLRPAFIVENAAAFTSYIPGQEADGPEDLYTTAPILFDAVNAQEYTAITYIYASTIAPRIRLQALFFGDQKEYDAESNFPVPQRNYLYDIELQILKPTE